MNVQNKTPPSVFEVQVGPQRLPGTVVVPHGASGVVVFAHGSGSSRLSPRNQLVAQYLQTNGLATLLFDLLQENESQDHRNVFDIELLSKRLTDATDWVAAFEPTRNLTIGLFGASTGSAAALMTAARRRDCVAAVVSRGGRPDLADDLEHVRAPTLLIVGGCDQTVLEINRNALSLLRCTAKIEIISGATHLFSEPGTLEQVARLANDWFQVHLRSERGERCDVS
jgi:putative phosphoribosyl transferase